MYLFAYIGEENKSIKLQKLAWKVKLSHKMNESRHNQTLNPKVLSYHLKLKIAKRDQAKRDKATVFCTVNSNWIYSYVKNKSVKLPFVTKNCKRLVGTSGDNSSVLIKFIPLWKQECQITPWI